MWNLSPKLVLLALCAVSMHQYVDASKILCAFPTPSRAQMVVAAPLFEALAQRGHKVTVLSSFPRETPLKNYRDVTVKVDHMLEDQMKGLTKNAGITDSFLSTFSTLTQTGLKAANASINSKEFRKIMDTESFDLVIVGIFNTNFLVGLGAHFKCPVVVMSTEQQNGMLSSLVGNPSAQSSVPNAWLGNVANMDLKHRAKNFFLTIAERLIMTYSHGKDNKYYRANFPHTKNYPKMDQQLRNVTLVLVNDHFSLTVPRPNLPAIVPIAGMHIKQRPVLPESLKKFMDSATHGVIYVSFGSNIKTIWLNEPKIKVLLASLGSLKQKVLLKWENATLPNRPKNVMISKWWPQTDILAHNNTKLFITHGGYNSMMEAQYFGVPLLGIPIYGDQFTTLDVVVHEKWAQVLHLYNFTEKVVTGTIHQMLDNPNYKKTVDEYGFRLRDQPQKPLETAMFWVEYVIRHKGADFMISPLVKQSFFVSNGFDVYLLVIVMGLGFYKLSVSFLSIVCHNMKEKYAKKEEKKTK